MLNRRQALASLFAVASTGALGDTMNDAQGIPAKNAWQRAGVLRVAATWRDAGDLTTTWAGILSIEPAAPRVRIDWAQKLPSRAHGILVDSDGTLLVVAVRPGTWLLRLSAQGEILQRLDLESGGRYLAGHALAAHDGQWIYTTETDPRDDAGWLNVRDRRTFQSVAQWPTQGIDPHHLLLDATGDVVLANGGIRRTRNDAKRELDRMESSLVHLDGVTGEIKGQWRVADRRLSLRHLAWSQDAVNGRRLLGIGIQAEHAPERRSEAPTLAIWDGQSIAIPSHAADADGYAGDIAAAEGGFVITSNRVNSAVWWNHANAGRLTVVAKMQEAYALGSATGSDLSGGVLIAAARGVGLWHPRMPAMMLAWPRPMTLENHWAVLPREV
jgi:uncharacterized protein